MDNLYDEIITLPLRMIYLQQIFNYKVGESIDLRVWQTPSYHPVKKKSAEADQNSIENKNKTVDDLVAFLYESDDDKN
jgi:hypothetical protein